MLLQASDIHVSFSREGTGFFRKERRAVLNGVGFSLEEHRCLGIVGESGCGKSTLGRVVTGLLAPDSGTVLVDGKDIHACRGAEKRKIGRCGSIVFQDYSSSVNPRFRVEEIVAEPLLHEKLDPKERGERVLALLEKTGLGSEFVHRYPHQLSGGQLQRVCIARALAGSPRFLLLDEAISSLDVSVQVQIMDLLIELKEKDGLSYIFITHDLEAVTYICDSVLFMHKGRFVESVTDLSRLADVAHPFSRNLLRSVSGLETIFDGGGERFATL